MENGERKNEKPTSFLKRLSLFPFLPVTFYLRIAQDEGGGSVKDPKSEPKEVNRRRNTSLKFLYFVTSHETSSTPTELEQD